MFRKFLLCLCCIPALCGAGEDELETVVVTASPIGDPEFLATIAGSADRGALLRSGGATLADALDWVPGVTGSGTAAGASRPVIRGFDANRVRTLEDGVGSFDVADIGADHGVPLDPLAAERVEVVRGAATLRYGSQAIGGVVNAITNRVPDRRAAQPRAEFTAGLGTVADSYDASGQANAAIGSFAVHADGFVRRADDYDTPPGRLDNSWVHSEGGALGASWFAGADDADRVGIAAVRYGSRYGLPGESAHIDMEQDKLMLRSAFDLNAGAARQLAVDGGWADYEHEELDEEGATLSTFLDREWDLRAEMLFGALGPLRESALGAQFQQRDFSALGEGADYLAPSHTRSRALFAFSEAPFGERWRLQAGARLEGVDVQGTPREGVLTQRSFTPVSVSAGLVYEGDGPWRVGLAFASAARAPAQTELFARGAHEGSSTFELGDATLDAERANSLELSLRWRHGRVHADGSVWTARFDRFIHGELTGRSCDAAGQCVESDALELRELRYTQRDARFTGAEGHADIELVRSGAGRLELNLLGDIVRAMLDGGENVPRIPPWHIGAGLTWESERLEAIARLRYAAEQDRPGAGDASTDGYTNLDVQLAWRPWGDRHEVELALVGSNLTDSLQRNAAALNKDEVPMPGRSVRMLLRARL